MNIRQDFRKRCYLLFPLLVGGCGVSVEEKYFHQHIADVLSENDSKIIVASELTNFTWDELCFERNREVSLKFLRDGWDIVFNLPYEEYYVAEPYVPGSPDGTCISGKSRIIVKKKYPGYIGPIEFVLVEDKE